MFARRDAKSTSQKRNAIEADLPVRRGIIAAGILDLIWGEFEAAHQPIQALGDHIPGRAVLAYIAAIWLIAGGAAILSRRACPGGRIGAGGDLSHLCRFLVAAILYGSPFLGFQNARCHWPVSRSRPTVDPGRGGGNRPCLACKSDFRSASPQFESPPPGSLDLRTLLRRLRFGASDRCSAGIGYGPQMDALGGNVWAILTGIAFVAAGIAISRKFWTFWLPDCLLSCCRF